jgi:hypothetical protein
LMLVLLRLGQHTLLAIVVGLWGATDNTLYWVLLWAMRGFGQHTVLDIIRYDVGRLINGLKIIFLKIIVEKSKCRFPYAEPNIPSQRKSHVTASRFPKLTSTNVPQFGKSHIHNLHLPPNRPDDGFVLVTLYYFSDAETSTVASSI